MSYDPRTTWCAMAPLVRARHRIGSEMYMTGRSELPPKIEDFARRVATVQVRPERSAEDHRRREESEIRWGKRIAFAVGGGVVLLFGVGAVGAVLDGDIGIAVVMLVGSLLVAVPVGVLGAMLIGPLVVLSRPWTWPQPPLVDLVREHEVVHDRSQGYTIYVVYVKELTGGTAKFLPTRTAISAQYSAILKEKARDQLRARHVEPWF